jgi:imidazolonepropionase-like amidohydrolase
VLPLLLQPRTPAEATADVERQLANGGDLVKLFTGSWVTRGKVKPMPLAIATAAVRAAHARKRLVFTHPSNVAGARVAIDAGVDVLAHAIEDLRGYDSSLLREMAAHKMALIPTLALFAADKQIDAIVNEVKEARALGVRILFGTDVGYRTEYNPAGDYALLTLAHFDGRAMLAALTTAPAEEFGASAHAGTLAVGHDADLVALDADPVEDVRALTRVRFTMRAGKVLWRAP